VQSLAGGVALLPFALTLESVGDVVASWRLLAALAYLVLFVSVLAYLLWFHLITASGATAASSYHFHDAAFRHAVRLASARRARRAHRSFRHRAGCSGNLLCHATSTGDSERAEGLHPFASIIPTQRFGHP